MVGSRFFDSQVRGPQRAIVAGRTPCRLLEGRGVACCCGRVCQLVLWMTPERRIRPAFLIRLGSFARNQSTKTGGVTLTRTLRPLWPFEILLGGSVTQSFRSCRFT